jgi:hypothetical protein
VDQALLHEGAEQRLHLVVATAADPEQAVQRRALALARDLGEEEALVRRGSQVPSLEEAAVQDLLDLGAEPVQVGHADAGARGAVPERIAI